MSYETTPITWEQSTTVESIRKTYGHTASSHAFPSIFMWREDMALSICIGTDFFTVKCGLRGDNTWFFPCGNRDEAIAFIECQRKKPNFTLCYATGEDMNFMEERYGADFSWTPCPDDFEYLYDREEQSELRGRKFMRIRNDLNRVTAHYNLRYELLSEDNMAAAMEVSKAWASGTHEDNQLQDNAASMLMLNHFEELKVVGVLGYVDDEPSCIVAGYPLADHIFDLSLSKQKGHISGLSAWTRQALVHNIPAQYLILNAEEDLGIAGIRQMKQIMRPSAMIELFEGRGEG